MAGAQERTVMFLPRHDTQSEGGDLQDMLNTGKLFILFIISINN